MRFPSAAELRTHLHDLFSEEATERKQEAARYESGNAEDLARLGKWLTDVVAQVQDELENPKDAKPSYGCIGNLIDIDGSVFSADELKTIEPQFVALHDLCLKHNVSLEFAGFDRLPSHGTATNYGRSRANDVAVEVDRGRTYNGNSHPNYWELRKAGVRMPLPVDRPEARTCGLQ